MMESIKIIMLGVIVYFFSENQFFKVGSNWFEELKDRGLFEERVRNLRRNFWKSFLLVLFVIGGLAFYLVQAGHTVLDKIFCLRFVAIIMALTASLGKGGWNIQSIDGITVIERIDRGMFVITQLGATVVLLLALTLK